MPPPKTKIKQDETGKRLIFENQSIPEIHIIFQTVGI